MRVRVSPARLRAVGVVLLAISLAALGSGPAAGAAAASRPAAKSNSQWLVKQLGPDGTLQNPLGGTLPDHGLMLDTLFAMYASGDGRLAAPIAGYIEQHATDYYTWDGLVPDSGYENVIVGGATAKILVGAEIAGRDPRNFGGHDMVAETKAAIMRSGPDKGRISDYAKTPELADSVSNNANMFGQALGVIGLAGAGENDQPAIDKMLTQQCSEGYFRIFFGYIPTDETGDHVTENGYKVSTCDEGKSFGQSSPDGDTTGFALSAMLAAREAGATSLEEPIDRAVAWLTANQTGSGGWGGGVGTEAPNTNSTGLIVQALADAGGAESAVDRGVAYLRSAQATAAADSGNSLAEHIGAIAYDPESYVAARTEGIAGVDTWIRAGAQASLGLSRVGFYDLTQGNIPNDPPTPPGGTPKPKPGGGGNAKPSASPLPPVSERAGQPAPPPGYSGGGTVVRPARSQAERGTATPEGRLGRYLAGQLVDGDHVEVREGGRTYVDYEATADLVFALRALGEQSRATARASRFLLDERSTEAYAHGFPYEKSAASYVEPLAKLQIIAQFMSGGRDAPAGLDATISRLRADLSALRDDDEFADTGEYTEDNAATAQQAWAVLATTAGPDAGDASRALDALIERQCADGTFPVNLAERRCDTGDFAATALVVQVLNGRYQVPRTPTAGIRDARGSAAGLPEDAVPWRSEVPESWSKDRTTALVRAATALNSAPGADGLVRDDGGVVDVPRTAAAAAGRQSAGLDASATARSLGALVAPDGGMPARSAAAGSDLTTSIVAAPGVAGRSWTGAENAPITAAVRLPLADAAPGADSAQAFDAESAVVPPWMAVGLVSLGILLAGAVMFGARHLHNRYLRRKGISST